MKDSMMASFGKTWRRMESVLAGAGLMAFTLTAIASPPVITIPPVPQTVFLGDTVTFSVGASGTAPLSYQWLRNGAAVSGATTSTLGFATSAADEAAQFSVQVTNTEGTVTSTPVALTIDFGTPGSWQTNRLIEITSAWRYDVSQTDLGSAWTALGYPDGAWAAGGGLLYVEDSALPAAKTTALPLTAGSLPTTCYFRTAFTNSITNAYSLGLLANTVIDDGVVLHLNGAETFRLRLPAGAVAYGTLASNVNNATSEGPFALATTNLLAGTNLLAAEVHQSGATSSDIVMGLTLDAVWQARLRDTFPPVVTNTSPAAGTTVSNLTQIEVWFSEGVRGVDAADLLINGIPATNLLAITTGDYRFQFPSPAEGAVNITWASGHGITDRSANANAFVATGFSYLLAPPPTDTKLTFSRVFQSSDATATNTAAKAVDGLTATFSLTADLPGSYWMAELGRPFTFQRIELVNRIAPVDVEMAGLTLSVLNLDDQVVFQTGLTNPGSGGIAVINLPAGISARAVRIGLVGNETNGAGNHRVGLAEVRLFGLPNIPYAPAPFEPQNQTTSFTVAQTTEYPGYPAANAVDGDTGNFTHTDNTPNNYWIADLLTPKPITKVELVNRSSCCDVRMAGLTLRVLDAASNSVASVILTNPGLGGTYTFTPPANTTGRYVKVGLEGGVTNGGGNYYVTLAEARVLFGTPNCLGTANLTLPPPTNNLASFKRSYMVRLSDTVPAASNANDDDVATETKTTTATVDGYWEVDLGGTYALYGVRTIGASGLASRMTNTICRLFDEAHDSVFERKLTGTPDVFDTDLDGPVFARYVRVGLEDKTRTATGTEWYIGFREVEVFGRPTNEVGILSFTTSTNQVSSGQKVTLGWLVSDVKRLEIHPALGSVGAYTTTTGVGSVSRVMTNSTEFILLATNNAGIFTRAVGVQVGNSPLSVRLSEIVANNKYSLKDGYGDASDWIELRNPGNTNVNLTGWGLSDDPALPMKWVFPATNLPPHSTLIVFASGRATSFDPAGNLHANFNLDKNGGALFLTASDGLTTVDSLVAYPELGTDLAYGRDLEGNWTFMEPTPGAVNTGATYQGWLKSLDWSHARGFYETNFTLTITNPNPGATVLYSTNGTVPSLPYTNGISIAGTKSVRIQAVRPGYKSARVQTKTFVFLDDVITSPLMSPTITQDPNYAPRLKPGLLALPTISIVVPTTPNYDEQEGSVEVLWPSGPDSVQENCGIYRYGGSYQTFAKSSFTVAFRSIYGNGKLSTPLFNGFDHGVLAKTSFDKLELNGGNQDMVARGFYMADRFVQDSLLDMGSLNPHGRFVHLYINGVYWGQYNCKEVLMENFMADYLGGSDEDYVSVKGNDNIGSNFVLGTPDAPVTQPWERVLALRGDYDAVRPYLDVSHFVDFMLLWGYGQSETEFRASGTREAGSGFKFWMNDPDGFLRTGSNNRLASINGPGNLWSALVGQNHPDFKMLLADRIYQNYYNNGAITPAANAARLAARMSEVQDSMIAECARWGYRTPVNWLAAADNIYANLFPSRTDQVIGFWRSNGYLPPFDPPTFNQYGGLATNGFQPVLTSASGTIYYTLNGIDPRLPGGGISPSALIWVPGAVTITADTTLTVRVRSAGGVWSALAQPQYLIASRRPPTAKELLVTEINYNPKGADDYEFIELYNAGTNLLDLSGVSLSNAVRYVFPNGAALAPGAFVLVVENPAAFAERYQTPGSPYYFTNLTVAGAWIGALDNSGETLSLVASNGVELSSVTYQTSGDWPERADGDGSSMELDSLPATTATEADVQAFVASGRSWSSSSLYNGSPGRLDAFVKVVRFNEILSHTDLGVDWLELLNTGGQAVNLIGATLTDTMDLPAQWTFTNATVLQPGEYKLISTAGLGFAFSELGERAFLLQVSGTNVIRFLDSVDFPAVQREESFGLFQRSDAELNFTELRSNTPGAVNSLPRVGPVVISEIMFTPPTGKAEFLELANITGAPVLLYDAARPTNVWKIEGVGTFSFPQGTVISACAPVIVCATNPADFRAQYSVSPAIQVFGPWTGALDNNGENIKLLSPGDPEPDGTVPYYRVDDVSYRTNAPWPLSVTGMSLERIPLQAYGNDPASWRAGVFLGTPGIAMANRLPVISVTGSPVVPQLSPLTLTLSTADLDVPWQTASLSATQLPPGSTYDPVLHRLFWVPTLAQPPGYYTARFTATDSAVCGTNQTTLDVVIQVTSPLSVSAQYGGGGMQLSFSALAGETYRVEFCTDLAIGDWQTLQEINVTPDQVVTVDDLAVGADGARFYRVRWLRVGPF